MAHKIKRNGIKISMERYINLPTQERVRRGDVTIRAAAALVEDPLRIDKLLAGGVIDEMQHLYGLQIITLWTIAMRPMLRATRYDPTAVRGRAPDFAHLRLSKMSAEDQFYKTMSLLRQRPHDLISKICFEEKAAIQAGRELGLPVNSITAYVRDAFDALGDALADMRRQRKQVEEGEGCKE